MKRSMMLFLLITLISLPGVIWATPSGTVYTWNVASGNWNTAGSWSPSGTPGSSDIVIFNGSVQAAPIVTNVPQVTISSLSIINNCYVTLTSAVSSDTITLAAAANALYIGPGSTLKFSTVSAIAILLPTGATGSISGDIIINSQAATVPSKIVSTDSASLAFNSGATFAMAPAFSGAGNGFAGNATGAIFKSGATYYQGGLKDGTDWGQPGSNPFTSAQFLSGSSCVFWGPTSSATPSMSGRTVGYFVWRGKAANSGTGAGTLTVLNDLVIAPNPSGASGALSIGLTGSTSVFVMGNLNVLSGATGGLIDSGSIAVPASWIINGDINVQGTFTPSTNAFKTYVLNGSTNQNVQMTGGVFSNLSVNNAAGITLLSNVTVSRTLSLGNGNINTGANTLALGASGIAGTVVHTSGAVIGNMACGVPAATGPIVFPLGTASNYNEATVNFTVAPSAGFLNAKFTASNPGKAGLPLNDGGISLQDVSTTGYWTITGTNGGTYNVTLEGNGFATAGTNYRVVSRAAATSTWSLSGTAGTNSNKTVVRNGITNGSFDFGMAFDGSAAVDMWKNY